MNEDVKGPEGCPVGDEGVEGPPGSSGLDILTRLKMAFPECEEIQYLTDLSSGIMLFNSWAQKNPDHYVSGIHDIRQIDVEIESNGDRYLDITNAKDELIEMTLPYELVEEFSEDLKVTTDQVTRRNQKAWEAIQKIRRLDEINLGAIAQCLKDVPSPRKTEQKLKKDLEEAPKESPIRRVRLKRDLKVPEEFGMKKGTVFETNTAAKDVACVKAKNGQFVTLRPNDFEEVTD